MSNRMGDLNLALALEGRAKAASNNEQLVVIAEALANLPDPEIDQSFMLALEQRILTEDLGRTSAARRLQVVPVISPTPADEVVRRAPVVQMPKRRFVVRRSMVAVAACMSLAAFPLVAAASSLPGSPFHGIKTSIEKMWIALTGTPTEDAFAHMSLAQVRIGEAEQLTAMHADPARVELALAMAEKQMNLAQSQIFGITDDPAVLRKMAEEARVTELQLRHAAGALKADGGAAFTDALELSVGIQDAVAIALGLEPGLPAGVTAVTPAIAADGSSGQAANGNESAAKGKGGNKGNNGDDGTDPADGARKEINKTVGCEIPLASLTGDLLAPVARVSCGG